MASANVMPPIRRKVTSSVSPGFTPNGCAGGSESVEKPSNATKPTRSPSGRSPGEAGFENSTKPGSLLIVKMECSVPSSSQ